MTIIQTDALGLPTSVLTLELPDVGEYVGKHVQSTAKTKSGYLQRPAPKDYG